MDDSNPLRNFTILGRLWIITCIVLGIFGLIAYVIELVPTLPSGRYPIVLFWVPIALATLAVYGIGYAILRICGFRLRRQPNDQSPN